MDNIKQPTLRMLYGNVADVTDPQSSSGSAYPLYHELTKACDQIAAIDASFSDVQQKINTLLNFHPQFARWKERRHKSICTLNHHSRVAQKKAAAVSGEYDFYIQQRALFDPTSWIGDTPYGLYTDCTHWNTAREWAPWSPFSERELERWFEREKKIYDGAALLFPRSQYAADSMINDYGQSPDKVFVVGCGINFIDPPPAHGSYDKQTVLFIGYDFERKGGNDLARAFERVHAKLPHARLVIVGPSELPFECPSYIDFLGRINDRNALAQLYQNASLFVMPSHYEPWGNVYLEAQAHGVPCIASDKAAAPEIIERGVDGELVPCGDVDALAECIIRLLQSPETLAAYGRAARKKVLEEYTWEIVAQRMMKQIHRYRSQNS